MFTSMLMASLTVFALETGPQVAPSTASTVDSATSIERALIERACGIPYTPWADEAAQQCFSDHLLTLRADFGRDLSKLSIADRKAVDTACLDLRRPEKQDVYVDCLSGQLAAIRDRQHRQSGVAQDSAVDAAIAPALSVAVELPGGQTSSWRRALIGGVIVTLVTATAGLGFLAMRPRQTRRTCRVCGVDSQGADLCAPCRHEAAEAMKREAAERIRNATLPEEKPRPEHVAEAERVEISAPPDVGLVIPPAIEDYVNEPAEAPAEVGADAPAADHVEARDDMAFDPYVVLGVPRDAGQDAIRAGYEFARKRYDPAQVTFLGYDAQEHFRLKAESVERAYQMLSAP